LFSAAKSGNIQLLSNYLDAGFNPNWSTGNGITPLMLASIRGRVEAVRLLLLRGAHVNTRDAQGRTALSDARTGLAEAPASERPSYRKVIRLLTEAGAID
jgi:ankyrin repeat protein